MKVLQGYSQKFFIKEEASFGAGADVASNDAAALTELKIEPSPAFNKITEHTGSASPRGEVKGAFSGSWSASAYLSPNAAGQEPNAAALFKAAFGTENPTSGGSSAVYSSTDAAPKSLCLVIHAGDNYYIKASGAVVESVEFSLDSGSEPKVDFSGSYASHSFCYGDKVAGAGSTVNSIDLAGGGKIAKGAIVSVGDENNGGSGYEVTGVSGNSISISPDLPAPPSTDDAVKPHTPDPITSGTILDGVSSALSIDGASMGFVSAKVSVSTGIHLLSDATSANPVGAARSIRELSTDLSAYFQDENAALAGAKSLEGDNVSIELRIGPDSAGKRCKLSLPAVRVSSAVEIPEAEESMLNLSGSPSGDAGSELTVTFD